MQFNHAHLLCFVMWYVVRSEGSLVGGESIYCDQCSASRARNQYRQNRWREKERERDLHTIRKKQQNSSLTLDGASLQWLPFDGQHQILGCHDCISQWNPSTDLLLARPGNSLGWYPASKNNNAWDLKPNPWTKMEIDILTEIQPGLDNTWWHPWNMWQ